MKFAKEEQLVKHLVNILQCLIMLTSNNLFVNLQQVAVFLLLHLLLLLVNQLE